MKNRSKVYELGSIIVALFASGAFSLSGLPHAMAEDAPAAPLDGRSFAVTVTSCVGEFQDIYCFENGLMAVEALNCSTGRVLTVGPVFASRVSPALFAGIVRNTGIKGKIFTAGCLSTFTGAEIADCPCTPTVGDEPPEDNPYNDFGSGRTE